MKSLLVILTLFLIALASSAPAQTTIAFFSAKAIDTSQATHTDTSGAVNLKNFPYVDVTLQVAHTDSLKATTVIEYLIGSTWIVAKRDTSIYGPATSGSQPAKGFVLRSPSLASLTPGGASVRARTTITKFATTSSGTKSYTLSAVCRRADQPTP